MLKNYELLLRIDDQDVIVTGLYKQGAASGPKTFSRCAEILSDVCKWLSINFTKGNHTIKNTEGTIDLDPSLLPDGMYPFGEMALSILAYQLEQDKNSSDWEHELIGGWTISRLEASCPPPEEDGVPLAGTTPSCPGVASSSEQH